MTDITQIITDTPAAVAAVTTTVENTATTIAADVKTDATKAEQSITDFRAQVVADIAKLKALAELDHQRVEDFIISAKAREESFVASVEARFASIETGTKGVVAWVKGLFGK